MGKPSKEPQSFEEMAAEPSFDPTDEGISSMTASFIFHASNEGCMLQNILPMQCVGEGSNLGLRDAMAIHIASIPGRIRGELCMHLRGVDVDHTLEDVASMLCSLVVPDSHPPIHFDKLAD
jgi:hypothetical protein